MDIKVGTRLRRLSDGVILEVIKMDPKGMACGCKLSDGTMGAFFVRSIVESGRYSLANCDDIINYEPGEKVDWMEVVEVEENETKPVKRSFGQTYEYGGESLTISEWAKRLGMDYHKLRNALKKRDIGDIIENQVG